MNPHIYVIHKVTQRVFACCGQGDQAVLRALAYAARLHALSQYLAMRSGCAPTASVPLSIVSRSGRKLAPGASLRTKSKRIYPAADGGIGLRRKPSEIKEAASLLPAYRDQVTQALAKRYPRTWTRYSPT